MEGTIGQEYCFYATSEVDVPDSTTVISSVTTEVTNSDLFFSEYAEGSSNNKYLEIYNGTGADVDLSAYSIATCNNGCDDTTSAGLYMLDYPNNLTFSAGTVIADDSVYVIYHGSASDDIEDQGDTTFTYMSNGDDVMALTVAGATDSVFTIVDIIGEMGPDPGSGWDVAGVANATKDHTLVGKAQSLVETPVGQHQQERTLQIQSGLFTIKIRGPIWGHIPCMLLPWTQPMI